MKKFNYYSGGWKPYWFHYSLAIFLTLCISSCQKNQDFFDVQVPLTSFEDGAISSSTDQNYVLYYGHQIFTRKSGTSYLEVIKLENINFENFTGEFTLYINNGKDKNTRVSSATIKIDNVRIVEPSEFSKNVPFISKSISLTASSILEVNINSQPGSFIDLWIEGKLKEKRLLYIAYQNLPGLITPDVPGSHSIEINEWKSAGFNVTTMSSLPGANLYITPELLEDYQVLRLSNYYPHNYTIEEGQAIYQWVQNGGKLLADIHFNADINAVNNFGVDRIDGAGGGSSGLSWIYHGAPLVIAPVTGPFAVNSIAIEAFDRPILKIPNDLNIAASYASYPVVVYKESGNGKVVITFNGGSYSLDVVHPGNAYRAAITMRDNLQFVKNIITYLK